MYCFWEIQLYKTQPSKELGMFLMWKVILCCFCKHIHRDHLPVVCLGFCLPVYLSSVHHTVICWPAQAGDTGVLWNTVNSEGKTDTDKQKVQIITQITNMCALEQNYPD